MSIMNCSYCGVEFEPRNVFCSASCKVRYYRKQGKHLPVPNDLRWQVWERDNFTCIDCGTREHLCLDHIVPQRLGGKTLMENLATRCAACNKSKGARTPEIWERVKQSRKTVTKERPAKKCPSCIRLGIDYCSHAVSRI